MSASFLRKLLVDFASLSASTPAPYLPLDYEPIKVDSEKHVHLVIVGFGRMGRALLLQAIRLCHYANGLTTKITIFDENMDLLRDAFLSNYPETNNIDDIDLCFVQGRIEAPDSRKMLQNAAADPETLLTVAICISEPDDALLTGINLPPSLHTRRIPFFIRQETVVGFSELIKEQAASRRKYQHFFFFGTVEESVDLMEVQDKMAQAYHQHYVEQRKQDEEPFDQTAPENQSWEDLTHQYRHTNKSLADMIPLKLRAIGATVTEPSAGSPHGLTKKEIEILARIEHNRWAADRQLQGWRYGPNKDEQQRVSPYLVPYDQLTDNIQEYDRITARKIPSLLKEHLNVIISKGTN